MIAFVPLPEVKAEGEDENDEAAASLYAANKTSIRQFPHLLLGLVSLLFYVGVETLAMASIVDYAASLSLPDPQVYTSYTVIGMVVGYLAGVSGNMQGIKGVFRGPLSPFYSIIPEMSGKRFTFVLVSCFLGIVYN